MRHDLNLIRGTAGVTSLGTLALLGALALAGCNKPASNAATNAAPPAANTATNTAAATPAAGAIDPAAAAEAKAFLDGLYAHYKTSKNNNFNMFDKKDHVFDKAMYALMAEDDKLLKGDVGVIDGDWLCACQDFVSLKATVTITGATPTTATAVSDFTDTGMQDDKPRHDDFQLVKEDGQWRIHDVKSADDTDFLSKELQDEIVQMKKDAANPHSADEAP